MASQSFTSAKGITDRKCGKATVWHRALLCFIPRESHEVENSRWKPVSAHTLSVPQGPGFPASVQWQQRGEQLLPDSVLTLLYLKVISSALAQLGCRGTGGKYRTVQKTKHNKKKGLSFPEDGLKLLTAREQGLAACTGSQWIWVRMCLVPKREAWAEWTLFTWEAQVKGQRSNWLMKWSEESEQESERLFIHNQLPWPPYVLIQVPFLPTPPPRRQHFTLTSAHVVWEAHLIGPFSHSSTCTVHPAAHLPWEPRTQAAPLEILI